MKPSVIQDLIISGHVLVRIDDYDMNHVYYTEFSVHGGVIFASYADKSGKHMEIIESMIDLERICKEASKRWEKTDRTGQPVYHIDN